MESPVDLLQKLIDEGEGFTFANFCRPHALSGAVQKYGGVDTPQWVTWKTRAANIVQQMSDENSAASKLARHALSVPTQGNGPENFEDLKSSLVSALKLTLDAMAADEYGELRRAKSSSTSATLSNKVFVVHGHDSALKTDVERFLEQIGLQPIVLHRQPDLGRTLIEKFEAHTDVGYVFVLLTPDEIAYTSDQEALTDASRTKERRARPNVIFEFGYFAGKLGRNRVCCIYKKGVVIPSDLSGLLYKEVGDSIESQAFAIIKELKAAGYKIEI